jgi:Tol biopolymer transport system component
LAGTSAYAPPGYLLFVREGALLAQPFDSARLKLSGEARSLAADVDYWPLQGYASFSVSQSGALAYQGIRTKVKRSLVWMNREGKQMSTLGTPGEYVDPRLSPDAKRVAFTRFDPLTRTADIWLLDSSRDTPTRFTFDPSSDQSPMWSPDGTDIVFQTDRGGPFDLYRKSSGGGVEEPIFKSSFDKGPSDWSSDGRFILYCVVDPVTHMDLWVLPLFGDRRPIPFARTEFQEQQGAFSPGSDGHPRWIAYVSDESGTDQVYVQAFPPSSGAKWQISTNGGVQPIWRRDGKELFYLAPDGKLMAVEVNAGPAFETGVPKLLFDTHMGTPGPGPNDYGTTADGHRFLVTMRLAEASAEPITVMLNWTAGLH